MTVTIPVVVVALAGVASVLCFFVGYILGERRVAEQRRVTIAEQRQRLVRLHFAEARLATLTREVQVVDELRSELDETRRRLHRALAEAGRQRRAA